MRIALWTTALLLLLQTSAAQAQEFRVRRDALQCALNNRALVEQAQGPLIFLDLSPCPGAPPIVGGLGQSTEQRTVSNLSTTDSDINNILIIRKDRLGCYLDVATSGLQSGGDVVSLNFGACAQ